GVRAAYDGERLALGGLAPLVVVAGDMAEQGAALTRGRLVREREHGGQQAVRGERDQVGGTVPGQQFVHGGVVGGEMGGNVHNAFQASRGRTGSGRPIPRRSRAGGGPPPWPAGSARASSGSRT